LLESGFRLASIIILWFRRMACFPLLESLGNLGGFVFIAHRGKEA
jgi:hypothetical protein